MQNTFRLITGVTLLILTTAGCSTMEGFGQDLQGLGNKIENNSTSNANSSQIKSDSVPPQSGVVVTPIK